MCFDLFKIHLTVRIRRNTRGSITHMMECAWVTEKILQYNNWTIHGVIMRFRIRISRDTHTHVFHWRSVWVTVGETDPPDITVTVKKSQTSAAETTEECHTQWRKVFWNASEWQKVNLVLLILIRGYSSKVKQVQQKQQKHSGEKSLGTQSEWQKLKLILYQLLAAFPPFAFPWPSLLEFKFEMLTELLKQQRETM